MRGGGDNFAEQVRDRWTKSICRRSLIKFACNQIWLRFPAKKLNPFHSYSNPIAILKYKQPGYSCFRRKILALYSENSIYVLYELPVFSDNVDFRAIMGET